MNRSTRPRHSMPVRILSLLIAPCIAILGCPQPGKALVAEPGLREYQAEAIVSVGAVQVNAMGGNLRVRRVELSIDTRLGTREIAAVWNSARGDWLWSFDVRYDGTTFVDESGASYAVQQLSPGQAIPGTHWVKLDGDSVRTKGGIVHDFDAEGRLVRERWADGLYPQLSFVSEPVAGQARTTRIDQCTAADTCMPFFHMAYDGSGRLLSIVDRTGRRAELVWDADGRLVEARDALDVAESRPGFRYAYAGDQLAAITSSDGVRTEIDTASRRTIEVRRIGPEPAVHRFAYEGLSEGYYHTRYFPPVGGERRYAYDGSRRLAELRLLASGETVSFAWDGWRPIRRIDPGGVVHSWVWENDDLVSHVEPSGNVIQYVHAPEAVDRRQPRRRPILEVSDSLGLVESRSYDAAGRLVSISNGAGETTTFGYDGDGLLTTITDPGGVVRTLSGHGDHGHFTTVTVDGTELTSVFDDVGNLLQGTLGTGPEWASVAGRVYDAGRNVRQILLSDGSWIDIDVRADGQATRIARPGGDDHEMEYDTFGRMVARRERVDGAWQTTTFEYDGLDRETAMERPNGMRRETFFDADGRPALVRILRHGGVEGELALGWHDGRVVVMEDSLRGGSELLEYDGAGRPARIVHEDGSFSVFEHDLRSRRSRSMFVEADLRVVADLERAYDAADREIALWHGGELLLERVYAGGRVEALHYGNGLARSFEYQPGSGALVGSTTRDGQGALVATTALTAEQDFAHDLTVVTQTLSGLEATTSESYQLLPVPAFAEAAGPQLVGDETLGTYLHDARSNLLVSPLGELTYNAEGNRLVEAEGVGSYAYDAAGFVTERAGVPLTWTAHGRLASHGADQLQWDMKGQLLSATIGGETVRSRFQGAVQADASGVPLTLDLGDVVVDLLAGLHTYRHFDFRGNVKFTSDQAGAVLSHYEYGGYGVRAVHGAEDDPVRFVGRAGIGELMILGERIYDPAVGRFLSPDPIFQTINQFSYTLANPVWFSDPDGTHPEGRGTGRLSASLILDGLARLFAALAAFSALTGLEPGALAFGGIAAILFLASFVAMLLEGPGPSQVRSGLSGREPGSAPTGPGGAPAPGGGSACAPLAATRVPLGARALAWLVPLQLLLGLLVLRRRREGCPT